MVVDVGNGGGKRECGVEKGEKRENRINETKNMKGLIRNFF